MTAGRKEAAEEEDEGGRGASGAAQNLCVGVVKDQNHRRKIHYTLMWFDNLWEVFIVHLAVLFTLPEN